MKPSLPPLRLPPLAAAVDLAVMSELADRQLVLCLWSGHGAPGRLMAADGPVSAEWLACMMRQAPPGVVVLSACWSGARDDSLHSLAESLSQSSITCAGMWDGVEDRAAVIYDVAFLRAYVSGRSVALAHRVACDFVPQRRWRWNSRRWPGPRSCCQDW